jgi:hypothetical protein
MTPNLDQTLAALLADWRQRPFAWGTADCCQFAREAAWRIHGKAVDAPTYVSERDAVRTLRRLGGYAGLLVAAGLQRRRAIIAARRGDFVIFHHEGPGLFDQGIALVTGVQAHAPTAVGIMSIPRTQWVECWGVD